MRQILVTQNGVTKSQPPVNVSYETGVDFRTGEKIQGARLNVFRSYDIPNEFGGRGRGFKLDGDGKLFPSTEAAQQWAHEHGYLQVFRSREAREFRIRLMNDMSEVVRKRYIAAKKGLR